MAVSPSVVAVLVTHDPGAWFDGTLAALAAQDHPVLHVLVIDAGSATDPTERIHAVLPHASVVRVAASPGFGAAANDVLELAPDADWFLFCHDDAAPESGAVRKLVATAERWEAGVVGPKLVSWDDPRRLLQVGEAVDKTGAAMSMVDRGELDQGQHDGLREVFSVPGAFTLVRSDLFLRIGGFDEVIAFLGENLSLCWRARIAGARVVVTSDVRVRHREGLRERFPSGLRRRLAARNRLRVMLTCYGRWHLLRVLPQAALASLVEVVSSVVTARPTQARAAAGAWWWNLHQLRSLRHARSQVRHFRQADDKAVRSLQVPGLLRPQLVMHRLAARQDQDADGDAIGEVGSSPEVGQAAGGLRTGWTSGAASVLLLLAGALLLGSRHLITRGVPVIGDLAPIDAPGRLFAEWSGGWRRTGLGSSAPAPTAFGLLSGLGTLVGGHVALLRLLLTVGLIPVGVLGAFRLLRPTGSLRAAAGTAIAYAILPLPYGALATGRWGPLAVYAAAPWLLAGLARAGAMAPLGLRPRPRSDDAEGVDKIGDAGATDAAANGAGAADGSPAGTRRSDPVLLDALSLGVVTALLAILVPAAPIVLLIMAVALALGSVLAFETQGIVRSARAAAGGALVAVALHLPWSWDLLRSWRDVAWGARTGGSAGSVDPLDVVRRGAGMSGAGALAWALLPAAAAVLLVGRDWRLAWAIRGWMLALVAWAAAWASWHRALGAPWPSPDVLLTLGGLGLAVAIGSGVAAVEADVVGRGRRLGVRRLVTAVGAAAFVVAGVPLVEASFDGYWQMPRGDYSQVLGFVDDDAAGLAPRLLWIGDPDVLPVPGRPLAGAEAGGAAYAISDGLPEVHDLWPGRLDGATARVGRAVDLALGQQTTRLGRLLAPMAVQYVIVPQRLAPSPFTSDEQPAAPALVAALGGQLDLERVDIDSAVLIYRNTAFVAGRAVVDDPAVLEAAGPDDLRTLDLADGSRPALRDANDNGVAAGPVDDDVTLYQSAAGSSHWVLEVDGERISPWRAFGWANAFRVDQGGEAVLRYETPPARRLVLALQVALWLAVLWLVVHLRRRSHRPLPTPDDGAQPSVPDQVILLPADEPDAPDEPADDPRPRDPATVPATTDLPAPASADAEAIPAGEGAS